MSDEDAKRIRQLEKELREEKDKRAAAESARKEVESKFSRLEVKLSTAEKKIGAVEKEKEKKEQEIVELNVTINKYDREARDSVRTARQATLEIESLSSDKKDLERKVRDLEKRAAELESAKEEVASLRSRLRDTRARSLDATVSSADFGRLQKEIKESDKARIDELETESRSLKKQVSKLQDELDSHRAELRAKQRSSRDNLQNDAEEVARLTVKKTEAEKRLADYRAETDAKLEALEDEKRDLKRQLGELRKTIEKHSDDLDSERRAAKRQATKLAEQEERATDLQKKNDELSSENRKLRLQVKQLESDLESVKADLEKKSVDGRLSLASSMSSSSGGSPYIAASPRLMVTSDSDGMQPPGSARVPELANKFARIADEQISPRRAAEDAREQRRREREERERKEREDRDRRLQEAKEQRERERQEADRREREEKERRDREERERKEREERERAEREQAAERERKEREERERKEQQERRERDEEDARKQRERRLMEAHNRQALHRVPSERDGVRITPPSPPPGLARKVSQVSLLADTSGNESPVIRTPVFTPAERQMAASRSQEVIQLKQLLAQHSYTPPLIAKKFDDYTFERAVVHEYQANSEVWNDGSWLAKNVRVKMERRPFAEGSLRRAYFVTREDDADLLYVAKISKDPQFTNKQAYQSDVEMQHHCQTWATRFNAESPPKKVSYVKAYLIEFLERPKSPLAMLEVYIPGKYKKYNNNQGIVSHERNTPQAFSHFTYERSNHELLVVDVQGVDDYYTDPQIHTKTDRKYGVGNLGQAGMAQFLVTHECNPVCRWLGLPFLKNYDPLSKIFLEHMSQGTMPWPGDPKQKLDLSQPLAILGAASKPPVDLKSFKCVEHLKTSKVSSICADGDELYSGSHAGEHDIKIWSLKTFQQEGSLRGHSDSVEALCINATYVFSGSSDKDIRVWDRKTRKCMFTVEAHSQDVRALIVDSKYLYSGSADRSIKVWHLQEFNCHKTLLGHEKNVKALALSGKYLFSGGNDSSIKVWDLDQWTCVYTLLGGHKKWVRSLSVVGGILISGANDRKVKVWDLKEFKLVKTIKAHSGNVNAVLARRGYFVSASDDNTLKLYDYQTLECVSTLTDHKGSVVDLCVTDRHLCSCSYDGVKVWTWVPS